MVNGPGTPTRLHKVTASTPLVLRTAAIMLDYDHRNHGRTRVQVENVRRLLSQSLRLLRRRLQRRSRS